MDSRYGLQASNKPRSRARLAPCQDHEMVKVSESRSTILKEVSMLIEAS
mgnify:CR=1 FL=1